jgi:hypothetical protein
MNYWSKKFYNACPRGEMIPECEGLNREMFVFDFGCCTTTVNYTSVRSIGYNCNLQSKLRLATVIYNPS